jgi:hypothetical protein
MSEQCLLLAKIGRDRSAASMSAIGSDTDISHRCRLGPLLTWLRENIESAMILPAIGGEFHEALCGESGARAVDLLPIPIVLTGVARHWKTGHYRSQTMLIYLALPMAIAPSSAAIWRPTDAVRLLLAAILALPAVTLVKREGETRIT